MNHAETINSICFKTNPVTGARGMLLPMVECLKWAEGKCVTFDIVLIEPVYNDKADPMGYQGYVGCKLNHDCGLPHHRHCPKLSLMAVCRRSGREYVEVAVEALATWERDSLLFMPPPVPVDHMNEAR